ncbi:hypothetical protein JL722_12594 [Aureococcus anophagefferens]|nr:hypothetical protein JL722_12594 [Aureococcus anophagefferens]
MTPLVARADDAMEGDKAARCDADARRIADAAMEGDKAARCDADARRIADDFCARLAEASRAGASAVDALVLDPALAAALADDSLDALAAPLFRGPAAAAAAPARGALPDAARPATSAVAGALRDALPALGRLFSAAPLAPRGRAYTLRYAARAPAADGGRVHRMHQDDSDLTLAVAGPWRARTSRAGAAGAGAGRAAAASRPRRTRARPRRRPRRRRRHRVEPSRAARASS